MQTMMIVIVAVLVLLALVVAAFVLREQAKRARLRRRFGPEYDRELAVRQDPKAVEHEFAERERRHADLHIRPVPPEARQRHQENWTRVQGRFVDQPGAAVREADQLVTALMAERGYPTGDYQQQLTDLSVRHARTLDHYRQAHQVMERAVAGEAPTEDLRQAMRHYRALFADLLDDEADRPAQAGSGARDRGVLPSAPRRAHAE